MKKLAILLLIGAMAIQSPVEANAVENYYEICEEIGDRYGICPELLQAVAYVESGFRPGVTSEVGATGLCQIVPKWHKARMKRLGVTDLTDPYENILVCADILYEFSKKYEVAEALNFYNKGEFNENAIYEYENGIVSAYAQKVMDKAEEFERAHGK